jgi:Cdc6-like AAA superfamily ATPase
LRKYEIITILATFCEVYGSESDKAHFDRVFDKVVQFCANADLNLEPLKENEFKEIMMRLKSYGLVNITIEGYHIYFQLMIYIDEIKKAFNGDKQQNKTYMSLEQTVDGIINNKNGGY